jgi:DNA-binding NarL/FixJ family response regulator
MLSLGASGFAVKRSAAKDLIHAIRTVMAGGRISIPAWREWWFRVSPNRKKRVPRGDELSGESEFLRRCRLLKQGNRRPPRHQRQTVERKANLMDKPRKRSRDSTRPAQGWLNDS